MIEAVTAVLFSHFLGSVVFHPFLRSTSHSTLPKTDNSFTSPGKKKAHFATLCLLVVSLIYFFHFVSPVF